MQRILIVLGIFLIVTGISWPWISKIQIGRLPGDIIISRPNLKIYLPITTMILLSILVSAIFWVLNKFK